MLDEAPLTSAIGGVSAQTAGVILRALINLEAAGGDTFFGEPEIEPADLLRVDDQGRGIITLFEVGEQAARPVMFSTFLMWVLADLFTYLKAARQAAQRYSLSTNQRSVAPLIAALS